jgi:hypothetical protein
MTNDPLDPCPLCGRPLGDTNLNEHHLVPRSRRGKIKERIHRICHAKIHATFTEKELERRYHSWESLREHEVIAKFIAWVGKKHPGFYDGSAAAGRKR